MILSWPGYYPPFIIFIWEEKQGGGGVPSNGWINSSLLCYTYSAELFLDLNFSHFCLTTQNLDQL